MKYLRRAVAAVFLLFMACGVDSLPVGGAEVIRINTDRCQGGSEMTFRWRGRYTTTMCVIHSEVNFLDRIRVGSCVELVGRAASCDGIAIRVTTLLPASDCTPPPSTP